MMRMTRAAIINVMSSPFIQIACLRGKSPFDVVLHYALPNAWSPIVTVITFNFTYLMGVVIVEVVVDNLRHWAADGLCDIAQHDRHPSMYADLCGHLHPA
jgi:ABC-type antimicrobial peptide transport system permease subunit